MESVSDKGKTVKFLKIIYLAVIMLEKIKLHDDALRKYSEGRTNTYCS